MITVMCGSATSTGRVREHNEDDFLTEYPVFAVADGMGGHVAGELASSVVISTLRTLTRQSSLQPADITDALKEANEQILFKGSQDESRAGMGTTAVGLAAVEAGGLDHWVVFNVGDSRVYRYAGGALEQLSTDHSEVQELIAAGQISQQDAKKHPRRNIVTRSLGSSPGPRPDVWLIPPALGDRYLICSDGLTGELDDEHILALLRKGGTAQGIADGLVTAAVSAGGRDNVTVVILEVTGLDMEDSDEDTVPRGSA